MSEQHIEEKLANKLQDLGYSYRENITDRDSLEANFREKFNTLNHVNLTDTEFKNLLKDIIKDNVFTSSTVLRHRNSLMRDDGTSLHYSLVNIEDWCKNRFEFVRQLRLNTQNSHHKYDVVLLINGIPVVQIELKNYDKSPHNAMKQIMQYKKDEGNGYGNSLMCFIQMFIVSNGNKTRYFANNNPEHFHFDAQEVFLPIYEWATCDNKKVSMLGHFADDFLAKCKLGEVISKYMVLVQGEKKLVMMRPYQIYAVKEIVKRVKENSGNGYIWHTTGSGKTLTSFKAATLLKGNKDIEKCIFVVDRKDLDRQTRDEFNRFAPNCVEENTNTYALVQNLISNDYAHKVIVTTIQKLSLALNSTNKRKYKEQLKPLGKERVVFIFDECHRSQFGENHKAIKEFFPKAQMFGFTGTPIFEENSMAISIAGQEATKQTTIDIFQQLLHAYTISDAIEDKNVLPFKVEYYGAGMDDSGRAPQTDVVEHILGDPDSDEPSNHHKTTAGRRFNALFATASINDAIEYYRLFKEAQDGLIGRKRLNVACVFSPPAEGNKDTEQLQEGLLQELEDYKKNPAEKKAHLKEIILDYNDTYGTDHKIEEFDAYYQDIQKRIKDQHYSNDMFARDKKIDITIVVDMLLTGFDAKYLNTLYVDKNLKHHGLIQAFSRTNRILNSTKRQGKIINFRHQHEELNEAIEMFSHPDDKIRAKEIWLVEPAADKIPQLREAKQAVENFFTERGLEFTADGAANIRGNLDKLRFMEDFKKMQRIFVQLDQYTDLKDEEKQEIAEILPKEKHLELKTYYLDFVKDSRELGGDEGLTEEQKETQSDPELILLASYDIDCDYIMALLAELSGKPERHDMTRDRMKTLIRGASNLIEESDQLIEYIDGLEHGVKYTEEQITQGYEDFKETRDREEESRLIDKHGLDGMDLGALIARILQRGVFDDDDLSDFLEPLELDWMERMTKKEAIMRDLKPLLEERAEGWRKISGLGVYDFSGDLGE